METTYTTIPYFFKFNHSLYAPSKNLYDPFLYQSGYSYIQTDWLVSNLQTYGYDTVADMLTDADPEKLYAIHNDALEASAIEYPYLHYLNCKITEDVSKQTIRNLVKDAHTIRDTFDYIDKESYARKSKDAACEVADTEAILEAAEREIFARLIAKHSSTKNAHRKTMEHGDHNESLQKYKSIKEDSTYANVDFLIIGTINGICNSNIRGLYRNLYKLYDFLDHVKKPKKPSAQKEYDFCVNLCYAIEIVLLDRYSYVYDTPNYNHESYNDYRKQQQLYIKD